MLFRLHNLENEIRDTARRITARMLRRDAGDRMAMRGGKFVRYFR